MQPCLRKPRLWLPIGLGLVLAIVLRVAFAQAPTQSSAQAPAGIETTLKSMLSALQSGSIAEFVAQGDDAFKAGMNQAMLDQVRSQLGPRLNQGCTATFLGTLHQQGYTVYLWKLEFKDHQDDRLVTMATKDGKVAGFFLR